MTLLRSGAENQKCQKWPLFKFSPPFRFAEGFFAIRNDFHTTMQNEQKYGGKMQYLNIFTADMRSPEFTAATIEKRGIWISILAFCADQENGGVIQNCEDWTDRQWLSVCGVTKQEAQSAFPLVKFENGNAIVWAYPEAQEEKARKNRINGRLGGSSQTAKPHAYPHGGPHAPPHGGVKEGKEKKEKESEEKPAPFQLSPEVHEFDPPTMEQWLAETRKAGIPDNYAEEKYHYKSQNGWPRKWKPFASQVLSWYRADATKGKVPAQQAPKPEAKRNYETNEQRDLRILREAEEAMRA